MLNPLHTERIAASARPIAVVDLVRIGPAVWTILLTGLCLGWIARRFGPERFLDFAGAWQTAWRFNTAIGFVAIVTVVKADEAQLAVAIGMAVPVANVFAVAGLSRGGALGVGATVRKVALNPFLLASVAGVLVGLSGLSIPRPIMAPFEMLAAAALPIALISIGATMNWGALAKLDRFSGYLCATKLILLPTLTYFGTGFVGMDAELRAVLVMFAALPTASAAHVLAAGFGANRELVATLIAQMTLLSAVTLPSWIAVINLAL